MAEVTLIDRRMFLTKWGKGAMAVAVLGPTVIGCASNGEDAAVLTPESAEPAEEQAAQTRLRWERVNFDFVSAYVLARGDSIAVVDTGTTGNASRIETALEALDATWDDVDDVILTHLHGDHVGGLGEVMTSSPESMGYAGEADLAGISAPRPLTAVNGGDEVFGLEVIATPGHTPGSISLYDEAAGLMLAGDALNTDGGVVLGANEQFSQDMAQANDSVAVLAERKFDTLVVGHGDPIESGASDLVAALVAG